MLLYPQGYEVTGCPCELPLWFTFVFENASSLLHRHLLWDLGFHLVLYASMLGPPAGLSMVRMRQPSSARHLLVLNLTQDLFFWSFLRHLARSSLFPSHAGGGVPLGFVMVALFTTTLRHCAMRSKHLAAHTTLYLPGQAAVMASLVAVLHFSVLLASSTVSRASHSSSALSAASAPATPRPICPLHFLWAALHHW